MQFNLLLANTKSFMYILNKSGPKMEPCGTPVEIVTSFEIQLSNFTYYDLLCNW